MSIIVCFGELLVDMVSDTSDAGLKEAPRFLKAPGGAPANVAVGLQRLGTHSRFVGQVGDDPFGDWLRETLSVEGVDVNYLRSTAAARTSIAFVATRKDGRKDICFYRNPGADAELAPQQLDMGMLQGASIFHCGSVSLSASPCREAQMMAAAAARKAGLLVSYDPNWRPSLWSDHDEARETIWKMMPLSDVVKVADEEWEFVTGCSDFEEGSKTIRAAGPRLVVVTRGGDGAYFNCEAASGHVEGFAVEPVDTLGAGDSFVAGLLTKIAAQPALDVLLNGEALTNALRFAHACGALSTQTAGAIPGLPTIEAVERFMGR